MPTNIDHRRGQQSGASMPRTSTISIAVVVAGFALLHLIGAAKLQHASAALPVEDARFIPDGD
jgi:hypothetical protein